LGTAVGGIPRNWPLHETPVRSMCVVGVWVCVAADVQLALAALPSLGNMVYRLCIVMGFVMFWQVWSRLSKGSRCWRICRRRRWMVCGTFLCAQLRESIDAITIYDTEALYYIGHHKLDIELPTYMVRDRLHAQHTSWLCIEPDGPARADTGGVEGHVGRQRCAVRGAKTLVLRSCRCPTAYHGCTCMCATGRAPRDHLSKVFCAPEVGRPCAPRYHRTGRVRCTCCTRSGRSRPPE